MKRETFERILQRVATVRMVRKEDILSRSRTDAVATARHQMMWLLSLWLKPDEVAALFGQAKSTVAYALISIQDRIDTEPAFAVQCSDLQAWLCKVLAA